MSSTKSKKLICFYFCIFFFVVISVGDAYSLCHLNNFRISNHFLRMNNKSNNHNNEKKIPKVIVPSTAGNGSPNIQKFLMMYTCKICDNRNAQMISKIAFTHGMVISTCQQCKQRHLIADNEGKLDMPTFGRNIEEYFQNIGEKVQKLQITTKDLEDHMIIDQDGVVTLVHKSQKDEIQGSIVDLAAKIPKPNSKTDKSN